MPTSAPGASAGSESGSAVDAAEAARSAGFAAQAGRGRQRAGNRLSAGQRRAELLAAAVVEFAEAGYHAARTADIAARAGVSQPYVYALFPDKRSLFLACHDSTTERIKESIEKASADSAAAGDFGRIFDRAYLALFNQQPHQVLFQVQAHAAATADPVIREPVRARFIELVELCQRLHDAPLDLVLQHVGRAMLGNVALALDLPPQYHPAV